MRDDAGVATGTEPENVAILAAPKGEQRVRRPSSAYSEPVPVELAWLVIEGAVFLRRLRGLLARI